MQNYQEQSKQGSKKCVFANDEPRHHELMWASLRKSQNALLREPYLANIVEAQHLFEWHKGTIECELCDTMYISVGGDDDVQW